MVSASNTPNMDVEENLDPITGSLATFVSPQKNSSDTFQENLRLIVQNLAGKRNAWMNTRGLLLMK